MAIMITDVIVMNIIKYQFSWRSMRAIIVSTTLPLPDHLKFASSAPDMHVSVHCRVVFVQLSLSKELMFVPIPSVMTAAHRDRPALRASVAQWPEIHPLVYRGQTVSADLP